MNKLVTRSWLNFRRYSYLLIASCVIVIAILALLFMQYQSIRQTHEQTRATVKANLELRLFEISEEAKRGILDQANHIMHSFRQNRIRERNIPRIERILTTLSNRYREVDDFYVVFLEPDKKEKSWDALRFVRPQTDEQLTVESESVPAGKMVRDPEASAALKRAWDSLDVKPQTTLYPAFDPVSREKEPRQYFFHTVYENSLTKPNDQRNLVGLLVLTARSEKFPTEGFYQNLIAEHRQRMKAIGNSDGTLEFRIDNRGESNQPDGAVVENAEESTLVRRFQGAEKIYPNVIFSVTAPKTDETFADRFLQSNVILGIVAAVLALFGLFITIRAAQSEMKIARIKSDFLANMSHELKTPLTAIRAFGDLIHSGRSKNIERIREYGAIIQNESDRLTEIINEILEMSRLEKGNRIFQFKEGRLRETIEDTIEVFRHSSRAEGFEIDVKLPESPVRAEYDEGALRQVLLNLLSNAVKYSDRESNPHIEVTLETEGDSAVISVTDFGVGISKQDRRDIFEPFHRSTNDNVRAIGGTGLGLAIAKQIIQGHGGRVYVESEIGKGSTFIVRLPILKEPAEDRSAGKELLEAKNRGTHLGYRG